MRRARRRPETARRAGRVARVRAHSVETGRRDPGAGRTTLDCRLLAGEPPLGQIDCRGFPCHYALWCAHRPQLNYPFMDDTGTLDPFWTIALKAMRRPRQRGFSYARFVRVENIGPTRSCTLRRRHQSRIMIAPTRDDCRVSCVSMLKPVQIDS